MGKVVCGWVDGWMEGWKYGWLAGLMGEWLNGQTDRRVNGWLCKQSLQTSSVNDCVHE